MSKTDHAQRLSNPTTHQLHAVVLAQGEQPARRVERWESIEYGQGGLVTVAHDDITAVYAVTDVSNGVMVISRDDADGWSFVCSGP